MMNKRTNKISLNVSDATLAKFKKYADDNGISLSNAVVMMANQTLAAYEGLETLRLAMEQVKSDSIEKKAIEENAKAGTL